MIIQLTNVSDQIDWYILKTLPSVSIPQLTPPVMGRPSYDCIKTSSLGVSGSTVGGPPPVFCVDLLLWSIFAKVKNPNNTMLNSGKIISQNVYNLDINTKFPLIHTSLLQIKEFLLHLLRLPSNGSEHVKLIFKYQERERER